MFTLVIQRRQFTLAAVQAPSPASHSALNPSR